MTRKMQVLAAVALLLGSYGLAFAAQKKTGKTMPFPEVRLHLEQNATDEDVEVVFEIGGGEDALSKLTVLGPDGTAVIDFTAPDGSIMGMRQFRFETPEPEDVDKLLNAYPEGLYTFTGTTVGGDKLQGKAKLSHKLPAAASFQHPAPDAKNVGIEDLKISWGAAKNVASYIVEIEHDSLTVGLSTKIPASTTAFSLPEGLLLPGITYRLILGTVGSEGNATFVETTFTTAAAKQ